MKLFKTTLLLLATLCACGDDDAGADTGPLDAGGMDASSDGAPLDASDSGIDPDASIVPLCPTADVVLTPVGGTATIGLISSDFATSAVSLLSEEETVLAGDWLTSGTTAPALSATLSGDVVFPSTPSGDGTLTVVDRSGVLSRFCITSGSLVGQLNTGGEGFGGNPHDAIIDGERGFVTRYDPNVTPGAAEQDLGSDIIGFDARAMERNGVRIDLSEFGGNVIGQEAGAEATVAIAARPDRMLRVGNTLVIGLERTPVDQAAAARGVGEGTVALIDMDSLAVTSIALEGSANCGQIVAVDGSDDQVIVACRGYSLVSFDGPGVRETSGLYLLSIVAGAATIEQRWVPEEGSASPVWSIVSAGGTVVVGVSLGEFGVSSDTLVSVDLADGSVVALFEADEAFALGQGIWLGDSLRVPHFPFGADPEVVSVTLGGESSSLQYTDTLPSYFLSRL